MKPDENFNFDEWALLAKADPAAFELGRRSLLDKLIYTSGRKELLCKWLQREIDDVRNRAVTPQDALQSITEMMNDQLVFFGENWIRSEIN